MPAGVPQGSSEPTPPADDPPTPLALFVGAQAAQDATAGSTQAGPQEQMVRSVLSVVNVSGVLPSGAPNSVTSITTDRRKEGESALRDLTHLLVSRTLTLTNSGVLGSQERVRQANGQTDSLEESWPQHEHIGVKELSEVESMVHIGQGASGDVFRGMCCCLWVVAAAMPCRRRLSLTCMGASTYIYLRFVLMQFPFCFCLEARETASMHRSCCTICSDSADSAGPQALSQIYLSACPSLQLPCLVSSAR